MNQILSDTLEKKMNAYDECVKKILSHKQILSYILKECVSFFSNLSIQEIQDRLGPWFHEILKSHNTEDQSVFSARIQYDLLFEIEGHRINIEAQQKEPSYPLIRRAVYYGTRLLAGQKNDPSGFQKDEYPKMKKVHTIWICMHPATRKEDSILKYSLHQNIHTGQYREDLKNYDLLSIVMIYLPKRKDELKKDMMSLLYVLFVMKEEPQYIKKILTEKYDILITEELDREVNKMCNFSQGIYEDGLQEGRKQGYSQGQKQGYSQGQKQGYSQGQKRGYSQGHLESTVQHVWNLMKALHIDADQAMEILKVDARLKETVSKRIQDLSVN
ncbi:hypothetical protein [uncultured Faecalicoccus sp.]|uniref:hypothetical protein n=1 Tax=uncultured Faecalicoccus sp. TaxID=1971760 RepID=UPI00262BA47B|nr:hypothetical protein [uncultured Faecalicoccus sp.]